MDPVERTADVGVRLHLREWRGRKRPFLLLHGLASNCRTWDAVAEQLNAAGHWVISVDQRGHGRSEKPAAGYDFASVCGDLAALLDGLGWEAPVVAGQSWGGNVVLEFAARHPGRAAAVVLVDGGFIELQGRPGMTWERAERMLQPPNLLGLPRETLERRLRRARPKWAEWGVQATLANFETLPDGTIRPRLPLSRHMEIVRALWEQRPHDLLTRVRDPMMLCVARDEEPGREVREQEVGVAESALPSLFVRWFAEADHDIHICQPQELTQTLLDWVEDLDGVNR